MQGEHASKLHTDSSLSSESNQGPWSFEVSMLPVVPSCHPMRMMMRMMIFFFISAQTAFQKRHEADQFIAMQLLSFMLKFDYQD